ncbi:MAG: carotenoid oxygenase family protein [Gammaproteobacteria bacterium]|nr:carotenoid oxygenase family protein [Gammaproteobacteria bacterium]
MVMQRRDFLKSSAVLGLAGLVPRVAHSIASTDTDWAASFAGALKEDPRLLGWKTPSADTFGTEALRIEGKWPAALEGTFWRNGPAVHDRHGLRYQHWFDGDGLLQAFRISGGQVNHRARVLNTPKLIAEDEAARRLYSGFGTHVPDGAPVRKPDDMNVANISVLAHHGELLALWEGGSASVVDPESLRWQGFKSWGQGLEGVPFTAHPKVDPDGTLWAFGYALGAKHQLVLYHISPKGALVKMALVPIDAFGMLHDFVITDKHLVFMIPPLVMEMGRETSFIDAHRWRPELGSRVLVVAKDDFEDRRWYELPPAFGFHHGNAWEEADGTIRFDQCLDDNANLVFDALRDVMRGDLDGFGAAFGRYAQISLSPSGGASMDMTADGAEFPKVAPSTVGKRNRYVYHLGVAGGDDWYLRSLVKRDLDKDRLQAFDFGAGKIPEEHVFVPSGESNDEDAGWLVGTVLDYQHEVSGLNVFDAQHVEDGPLATAWLPYPMPLGFHGCFRSGLV